MAHITYGESGDIIVAFASVGSFTVEATVAFASVGSFTGEVFGVSELTLLEIAGRGPSATLGPC